MPRKKTHQEILGSEDEAGSILLIVFIPSKTHDGSELAPGEDQQMWANAVGDLLAELFGGGTEMPMAKGKWRNDDGVIITEDVLLIHCYAKQAHAEDERKIRQLAVLLHRMGKKMIKEKSAW